MTVNELARNAKTAARTLAIAGETAKNAALHAMADAIWNRRGEILAANRIDVDAGRENALSDSLLDRLTLTDERIKDIVEGVRQIAALADPVGGLDSQWTRPNGLRIGKKRVPLGVIGIIYEARPNVTVDAAALCLKSGNAVVLRGGREAIRSNVAVAGIMRDAIANAGLPCDCVCLIEDTSRDSAAELMRATGLVDVLIPRGGAGLIRSVVENATVPVIQTGTGICHVYVDGEADLESAAEIIYYAKCSRPSTCNAAEVLLVARSVAREFLPMAAKRLSEKNVELRGCEEACRILPGIKAAADGDFDTEFLDYILAIRVVEGIDEAIGHINTHGTGHSESIVTDSYAKANRFHNEVDSAAVYVNASTRFTDGFEFGFGGEIGISTQKLHARGPMGLFELTTAKYIIFGDGQVR